MLIAVTGGMGSGKSLLGEILAGCAEVYDADKITRDLQAVGGAAYEPLVRAFGAAYFTPELDRARLGRAVFADKKMLDRLNGIMRPLVKKEIEKIARAHGKPVFVLVPLLFEANLIDMFDAVWLVAAGEGARKKRTAARDPHLSSTEIDARFAAQLSEAARLDNFQKAAALVKFPALNRIVENNGSVEEFKEKVLSAFHSLFDNLY
ncbi:MAG: dephospho-CoA kinase [Clostridiales bacterium]|jgi:dephospho-CoA kinase|nr:dephospho-CoA kinase [Clostridiales bacterium]